MQTGAIKEAVFTEDPAEPIRRIGESGFEEPVMRVYESGPTGFGLARALREAGIGCAVAARPSHGAAPAAVAAKALKCEDRLFKRREALGKRGVCANEAKCAIARELAE